MESFARNYPFVPDKKGINFSILNNGCNYCRPFFTETSKRILVTTMPTLVDISENTVDQVSFSMAGNIDHGEVYINLMTRNLAGIPFPDFYAGSFVRALMEFFPDNGSLVECWRAEWYKGATNYGLYEKTKNPWRTWTGRMAESLDFTHVEQVEPRANLQGKKADIAFKFYR